MSGRTQNFKITKKALWKEPLKDDTIRALVDEANQLSGESSDIESDLDAHIADTTTHGTSGNIVGDSDAQTLTNKTLGNTAASADGIVLGATGVRFDAFLRDIKELRGLGGADGKAIRVCATEAEIKAACEDASVYWVLILPGTYTFDAVIEPTSYTWIIGLGQVQMDWDGAAWGKLFYNTSATNVLIRNITFNRTGNIYYCIVLQTRWHIINCHTNDDNCHFLIGAAYNDTDMVLEHCTIAGGSYINGRRILLLNCDVQRILEFVVTKETRLVGCTFRLASIVYIKAETTFSNRDIVFEACVFETSSYVPFYFMNPSAGAKTIRNVKCLGCTFEPPNNTLDCVAVEDDADLTVEDVSFSHCTFRDYNNCYTIPANPTASRWRFDNNTYIDEMGTTYNFTDPDDFVYTMDGPAHAGAV